MSEAFQKKPFSGPIGSASSPSPSAQEILRARNETVPPPLDQETFEPAAEIEDIDFSRYTSPEFFQSEMDKIWCKVWQWACREEHIPETGDYIVYDIGPYSIIVVRTEEDKIKAYYNACLHRGTRLCGFSNEGNAEAFVCPYHGWSWHIDGQLREIPSDWDFAHVQKETFKLPEVQVDTWNGFVFINLDLDAPPLLEYLQVLPEHFANWNLEDRYISVHVQKELPCNWKAAFEAFIENYHTRVTHPQLLATSSEPSTQYDLFTDHVTRFYCLFGLQSPHLEEQLTEQEILERMPVSDSSVLDDALKVPEGETARRTLGKFLRDLFENTLDVETSHLCDSEILDSIEYTLFPNMFLFPGLALPMIYRFRPLGLDPHSSLMDLVFLTPVPRSGERPAPADIIRIGKEVSFTEVETMDSAMARIYDQDTGNLENQQLGFMTSKKPGMTLANYQESRIRQFHQVIDKYFAK
jgi:nitrite reductase/ring-hydroxylating ferredoxin subunit